MQDNTWYVCVCVRDLILKVSKNIPTRQEDQKDSLNQLLILLLSIQHWPSLAACVISLKRDYPPGSRPGDLHRERFLFPV